MWMKREEETDEEKEGDKMRKREGNKEERKKVWGSRGDLRARMEHFEIFHYIFCISEHFKNKFKFFSATLA